MDPLGTNMNLLKRYHPSDSFCTFISLFRVYWPITIKYSRALECSYWPITIKYFRALECSYWPITIKYSRALECSYWPITIKYSRALECSYWPIRIKYSRALECSYWPITIKYSRALECSYWPITIKYFRALECSYWPIRIKYSRALECSYWPITIKYSRALECSYWPITIKYSRALECSYWPITIKYSRAVQTGVLWTALPASARVDDEAPHKHKRSRHLTGDQRYSSADINTATNGSWIQKPTHEILCVIEVCERSVCVCVWPSMPTDAVTSAPVSFMLVIPLYLSAKTSASKVTPGLLQFKQKYQC